jgi:hypothetical protein
LLSLNLGPPLINFATLFMKLTAIVICCKHYINYTSCWAW